MLVKGGAAWVLWAEERGPVVLAEEGKEEREVRWRWECEWEWEVLLPVEFVLGREGR